MGCADNYPGADELFDDPNGSLGFILGKTVQSYRIKPRK